MKRQALLFLIVLVLLVSCSKGYDHGADEGIISSLKDACDKVTSSDSYKAKSFRLEMTFSEEDVTLMYAHGYYEVDLSGDTPYVSATMTQTVLGASSGVKVEYKNGISTTTVDGVIYSGSVDEEEFFGKMIFVKPFVPEKGYITGIDNLDTAEGKGYKVYLKNPKDLLFPLIGMDIYETAMIANPNHELMNIKNASISYIIDAGSVKSMTIAFKLYLYETPPYIPGRDVNLEDYMLEIGVNYNVIFQ